MGRLILTYTRTQLKTLFHPHQTVEKGFPQKNVMLYLFVFLEKWIHKHVCAASAENHFHGLLLFCWVKKIKNPTSPTMGNAFSMKSKKLKLIFVVSGANVVSRPEIRSDPNPILRAQELRPI